MKSDGGRRPHAGREVTSLAERFGALLIVRLGVAGTAIIAALVAPSQLGLGIGGVAPLIAGYLAVGIAAESVRRAAGARFVNVQNAMLLVDAAFIALVITPSGGPDSHLVFLFYVHLIAVTLLGSYRTGLRIALWDSVLFILIYTFSLNTAISRVFQSSASYQPKGADLALSIVAFWVVAMCTAMFSWLSERELRRSKDELRALAAMGTELERSQHSDEIIKALLVKTTEAFGMVRGAVMINDAEGTRVLVTGADRPVTLAGISLNDDVVRRAWTEREPVLVRQLEPLDNPVLLGLLPGARNLVVLPVTAEGEPLGAMAVERGGPFGDKVPIRTVTMLSQFTAHAALALRNARLLSEVERLARLDGLTGLANRRVFEVSLEHEVRRAQRNADSLSLIVIDIDHFKRVNDTWGHQAGDGVLRRIGEVLMSATRDVDIVARYGGEEFAILLPACEISHALEVAERIRGAIADHADLEGVTASAGVAALPANALDGQSLLAASDEALYESKRTGRDRTTVSSRVLTAVLTPAVAARAAPIEAGTPVRS